MDRIVTVTVAANNYDLTDLATVKSELLITGTDATRDARLSRQISEESARIADYLGRVVIRETVSEAIRLDSREDMIDAIPLSRWPISSITSVTEDDVPLTADDYETDAKAGTIHRVRSGDRAYWWARKIVVVYAGGYLFADVPKAISAACLTLMKHRWSSATRDASLRSITIDGVGQKQFWVGQQGDVGDLPPEVAAALDRYKETSA